MWRKLTIEKEWEDARTVSELIEILKKYPGDYLVCGVGGGEIIVEKDKEDDCIWLE